MDVFTAQSYVSLLVVLVLLLVKVFAFANSVMFPAQAYLAADKLTKPAWATILGIGVAAQVILLGQGAISLINLIFTIAAFVYLADVRPALARVTRR